MAEPARVAAVIEDVSGQLGRWSDMAQESVADSVRAQTLGNEHAARAAHDAAIHVHHAEENEQEVATAQRSSEQAGDRVAELLRAVAARRDSVGRVRAFAVATLEAWTAELADARAWLARARDRLARAVQWVQTAETDVRRAERAVRYAQAALDACLRNPKKRSCRGQERRLMRAHDDLRRAEAELTAARAELHAAQLEVAAAEARVACCEEAVRTATAAVAVGEDAARHADDALHHADLANDYQTSGARAVTAAAGEARAQRAEADAMAAAARRAVRAVEEARSHLRSAESDYQSGRRYARDAIRDLGERVERLRAYDRPGL